MQIAKNKERAAELAKLLKDLEGELDDFDRSARQERLDAAKKKASEKLAALGDLRDKIKKLDEGSGEVEKEAA